MTQQLTELEQAILIGAVADLAHAEAATPAYGRDSRVVRERIAKQYAVRSQVVVDAATWLGCNTAGDVALRMAISRVYVSLEKRGLIRRVADGYSPTRTTHLEITEAGKALAATLTTEAATDG